MNKPRLDARLMKKAAPDLLEACVRSERYLQGVRTGKPFEEGDLVDIIKAAIRKATEEHGRKGIRDFDPMSAEPKEKIKLEVR